MIKLNKDNWKREPFSFVADCVERHDKNPIENGLTKFIGLDNIDSSSLSINNTGEIENGTTFSKTFQSGDVLFGKRRPYLRKVAIANFSGICSGDILVFRAREKNILCDLLPLYVSSEGFIQYAISTSAGSLSPRTKWRDLAKYEISLPPFEEQKQIVDLFKSIETTIKQVGEQEKHLKKFWKKLIDEFVSDVPRFGSLLKDKSLKNVNYCDVTEKLMRRIDPLTYGIERIVAGENLESEDFKIRTWQKVGEGYLGPAFHVLFKAGDILYGSRRTYLRKVSFADFDGVCANTTYVIKANESILLQGLLKHIMLSERFTQYSIGVSKGSTNPYINWKDLDNFSFQIPDTKTQKEIVKVLDDIFEIVEQLKQQKTTLNNLKQKLLNEILN